MLSKTMSRYAVSVLGFVLVMSLCIGLPGAIAEVEPDLCEGQGDGCLFGCPDDADFTMDFRLEDCKFKTTGINPFFILKPGYRLELITPEGADVEVPEKSVETVLCDTYDIYLDGRRITTRVVEERAFEIEIDEESGDVEEKLIEISLNYFAICKKTNAVYYFGEFSQDCENGFTDDEQMCEGENGGEPTLPLTTGSWEAGVNGARPGLIMPGTPLKGARYFQEIAVKDGAVDRGEIVDVGLTWPPEEDLEDGEEPDFTGCIEINDTNPTDPDGPVCDLGEDVKIYCPRVGLVQDQELVLVKRGFVGCDDDKSWRRKWGHYHPRF